MASKKVSVTVYTGLLPDMVYALGYDGSLKGVNPATGSTQTIQKPSLKLLQEFGKRMAGSQPQHRAHSDCKCAIRSFDSRGRQIGAAPCECE